MTKIGVLGGTFNPPHFGHLRLSEEACETYSLDRVVFIPTHIPPHKNQPDIAEAQHRLEMTNLACKDNPKFEVSDLEVSLKGKSYTINTLEVFAQHKDAEVFFIIGSDSLKEIHLWKDYTRLFELSNFIVIPRPGTDLQDAWAGLPVKLKESFTQRDEAWIHKSGKKVISSKITGLEISSTMVRNLVRDGRSIRYLIPDIVISFIQEHNLYESGI